MKTTRARRKMIEDAAAAGYFVYESDVYVKITKHRQPGQLGVILWEDGTAHRTDDARWDVVCGRATPIRTLKAMRSLLNL